MNRFGLFLLSSCFALTYSSYIKASEDDTQAVEVVMQTENFDKDILTSAEKSLNSIQSVDADFIQTSSNNDEIFTGHLKLLRPNKMLLTYDNEEMPRIIADGYSVIYVEDYLEQVTYLGLEDTPAFFLIQDTTSFSDERIKVLTLEKNEYQVRITVALADDSFAGKMTFIFMLPDYQLAGWEITDAKRVKTVISLQNVQMNPQLDKKQFEFINPYTDKKKKYPFLRDH